MTTRISKIARLPKEIREQLNERLESGQLGRTILKWVNHLPETKAILAELFAGKAITHQNLSEWRSGGYQDWLFHQQRLEWFDRLNEEDTELSDHDGCPDTYEAMSRYFVFEIGQALTAMKKIKNPNERWERLESLTDRFARLQNSYNRSRRVALEWDKFNDHPKTEASDSPEPAIEAKEEKNENVAQTFLSAGSRDFPVPCSENGAPLGPPASRRPVAINSSKAEALRDSVPDCGSPLPLSQEEPVISADALDPIPTTTAACPNSSTPKPLNSPTPPPFQSITTPPPTTPVIQSPNSSTPKLLNSQTYKVHSIPIRGRRFTCIEG